MRHWWVGRDGSLTWSDDLVGADEVIMFNINISSTYSEALVKGKVRNQDGFIHMWAACPGSGVEGCTTVTDGLIAGASVTVCHDHQDVHTSTQTVRHQRACADVNNQQSTVLVAQRHCLNAAQTRMSTHQHRLSGTNELALMSTINSPGGAAALPQCSTDSNVHTSTQTVRHQRACADVNNQQSWWRSGTASMQHRLECVRAHCC
jgi:hypothetical protein